MGSTPDIAGTPASPARDAARLTVFVSSTSEDLRDHRAVARSVILDMRWTPEMMEHFGAMPEQTVDACLARVAQSHLLLLIVAHRRGWVPGEDKGGNSVDSITALELACAHRHQIPVLILMADDCWPGNLWENDQPAREWIQRFRETVNHPAVFFAHEPPVPDEAQRLPGFRAAVRNILMDHRDRLRPQTASATPAGVDFFGSALDGFADGDVIPFVGQGTFGDGPLGLRALVTALGEAADQPCLATAAEYRERFKRDRSSFLREFRRTLDSQTRQTASSPVHDLLVRLAVADRLPLIVSATYDQVLERMLDAAGRPPVVMTHVLSSTNGEHDGKTLVLRPGCAPEVCLSDQVELVRGELVVYKPLGLPFLNTTLATDVDVDTVVISESDHLSFLARLDNQGTGIPNALIRSCFRRHRLLFLGYTLDVWQYRLVMRVFELLKSRVGERATADAMPPLAVRQPTSKMEELFWQRLNADLVQRDPNDFARCVIDALPTL